jgi:cytochrome c oxidase subunit 4
MSQHIIPVRTNLIVFGCLMGLLVATVGIAYFDLGDFNIIAAMTIAVTKATLIVLYFMHLRYSERIVWVYSAAALLWLSLLIAFTTADYVTRGWLNIPGK